MMETATTDIEVLAELCLQSAKTLKGFLATNGSNKLAFDAQALPSFPKGDETTQRARDDLRNAAKTIYDLVTGPQECLMESSLTSVSLVKETWKILEKQARKLTTNQLQFIGSMRYICHFKVPDSVPETGVIDYLSLAQHCGVDPGQLKQNLRFAMSNRVFYEPTPKTVAHTAGSLLLREGKPMRPFVQWLTEDCTPMVAHQIDAMEKGGHGSQEPNQTAVNYAYGDKGSFYDFIRSDPVRERRFGTTIQQVSEQPSSSVIHI